MKPVDQEFIHKPEIGQYGDCQRAVIASLLDMPIASVPHFLALSNNDAGDYWDQLQAFLRLRGMAYLTVPARFGALFFGEAGDVYHEISGPSPRSSGVSHAVVGCNGQIVFDPHPSRAGLAGDPAKWEHAYLVIAQPVQPAPVACSNQQKVYFIKGWDACRAYEGLPCNVQSDAALHRVMPLTSPPTAQPEQPARSEGVLIEEMCARIEAADALSMKDDYMLDSDDCIKVLRGTWGDDISSLQQAQAEQPTLSMSMFASKTDYEEAILAQPVQPANDALTPRQIAVLIEDVIDTDDASLVLFARAVEAAIRQGGDA